MPPFLPRAVAPRSVATNEIFNALNFDIITRLGLVSSVRKLAQIIFGLLCVCQQMLEA